MLLFIAYPLCLSSLHLRGAPSPLLGERAKWKILSLTRVSKTSIVFSHSGRGKKEPGFFAAAALNDTGDRMKVERQASRLIRGWGALAGVKKDRGPSASLGMTHFVWDDTRRRRHEKCAGWLGDVIAEPSPTGGCACRPPLS
jgi:hypothetical protein